MKFSAKRMLLRFKPFDEQLEDDKYHYRGFVGQIRIILTVLPLIFAVMALVSSVTTFKYYLGLMTAAFALLGCFDWQQGFKAKALNKLYEALIALLIFLVIYFVPY